MAKAKLSTGTHILSESKRKGTKMVVHVFRMANGKAISETKHIHD
jgi:hypothetical protein